MTATRNSPRRREGWNDAEKLPLSSSQDKESREQQSDRRAITHRAYAVGSWLFFLLSIFFFTLGLLLFIMVVCRWNSAAVSLLEDCPRLVAKNSTHSHVKDLIYGHVHMAKTGGTSINGNLSVHYERICGHKGYSYDAIASNERYRRTHDENSTFKRLSGVPAGIMNEMGYQDCDWISNESRWQFWRQFQTWPIPFELHVPCRSPVDHLMSQCNHRGITFDCNKTGLEMVTQVDKCLVFIVKRYNNALNESLSVKCFDYSRTSHYMDWIGQWLQRRRVEADYVLRETNKPRHKEQECVWNRPDVQKVITARLVQRYDYYKFCEACLGTEQDLFGST